MAQHGAAADAANVQHDQAAVQAAIDEQIARLVSDEAQQRILTIATAAATALIRSGAQEGGQGHTAVGVEVPRLLSTDPGAYLEYQRRVRAYLTVVQIEGTQATAIILSGFQQKAYNKIAANYATLLALNSVTIWPALDEVFLLKEATLAELPRLVEMRQGRFEKIDSFETRFLEVAARVIPLTSTPQSEILNKFIREQQISNEQKQELME
jgi:hypothetical protein